MSNIMKTVAVLGVVAGLGVAALPLSSYAAGETSSTDVTIQTTVNNTISVTSSEATVDMGDISIDGPVGTGSTNITVHTANAAGYTLTMTDKDDNLNMVKYTDDGLAPDGTVTPTAGTNMIAPGVPATGTSAWGFRIGEGAYQALTAGGVEIAETEAAPAGDEATTQITFGVSAGTGLVNGVYKDTVVFTATAN